MTNETSKEAVACFDLLNAIADATRLADLWQECWDFKRAAMLRTLIAAAIDRPAPMTNDKLREALAELIACKELKDWLDSTEEVLPPKPYVEYWDAKDGYAKRNPLAWEAALAALAAPVEAEPVAQVARSPEGFTTLDEYTHEALKDHATAVAMWEAAKELIRERAAHPAKQGKDAEDAIAPLGLDDFRADWDGNGAKALTKEVLRRANPFHRWFLPHGAAVAVGGDGSIGLVSDRTAAYLYVDVLPDLRVHVYRLEDGVKFERVFAADKTADECMAELTAARNAKPAKGG